ncbi:MAG: tetratricopeptide repeat protein [Acidobacteriota bacterium]
MVVCNPARAVATTFLVLAVCMPAAAQDTGPSLASADTAMQAARFADAARQYEAWLKTQPDSKEVLFALGVCYLQLGRNSEAVATLRKYLTLVPDSASGHTALGIALLDGTGIAEAKAELETAVRLNPAQPDAVEALARIYLADGDPAKALSLLRPLDTPEGSEEKRALLGEALIRTGQAEAAAALFERGLAAKPRGAVQTYVMTAWARIKSGDLERAAEICEQGMRIYPDSEIEGLYLSLPAPLLARRTAARLERLTSAPDVAELIALGRVLTDADPAQKTRAGEIAQRLLAHAIELAPDNASAHYNYGRALRQTSLESALKQWGKALTLGADDELRMQIYTQIGNAKHALSDLSGAERAFRAALEINQRLPRHRPEPALEYVRFLRARPPEAEALLSQILSWNPLFPPARLERAKLLAARGQWDKVIEEGEFVLRSAGENTELLHAAHALLARAYYRLNQPEKAQWHRSRIESQ